MDKAPEVPVCIGIILDGNRRWAKAQVLTSLEGHHAGMEKMKEVVRFVRASGVKHLTVYAFSTENWNRKEEEVSYLMDLFHSTIQKEMNELGKEGVRVRFIGQRERFSSKLQEAMHAVEKETEKHESFTFWVCLSYGGRAEIAAAAQAAAASGEVTEESISNNLWTKGMPDPDIIIRTSGEQRLSGFLTWQSIYSELFFIDTKWPAFTKEDFDTILTEFSQRERRHGK